MRLLKIAALSFLSLTGIVSPALCADNGKEKLLASCLFDVGKTMVLYNAVYENGYMGKKGLDASQQLQERVAELPTDSAEHQSLQRADDDQTKKRRDRERQIESSLMDKCMLVGGYEFTPNNKDPFCFNSKSDRINESTPHCWAPAQ